MPRLPVILLAVLVTGIVVPAAPAAAEVTFTTTVANHSAGTCAEVPGGASTSALQLAQAACGAGARQAFTFTPVAGVAATYTVRTLTSGSCVERPGTPRPRQPVSTAKIYISEPGSAQA